METWGATQTGGSSQDNQQEEVMQSGGGRHTQHGRNRAGRTQKMQETQWKQPKRILKANPNKERENKGPKRTVRRTLTAHLS